MPYLEQDSIYKYLIYGGQDPGLFPALSSPIAAFINPLDPDSNNRIDLGWAVSFAANARVFSPEVRRPAPALFTDGLSNTITYAETKLNCRNTYRDWNVDQPTFRFGGLRQQRPTFADNDLVTSTARCEDYYPITTGNPPVSVASANVTFQVRPSTTSCDPRVANGMSHAGLIAVLGDGSVRTFRKGIDPAVFWGAVTPDKGEVITID
jgi:hypothetical protein